MAQACAKVCLDVASGHTLSHAMKRSGSFNTFHTRLIEVGERTGALSEVLTHLAIQEEAHGKMVSRVRSAVVYPTLVALVALVGLVFVPPFVLGGLFTVIENSGVEPPLLTRIVMILSYALRSPWLWAVVLAFLFLLVPILKRKLESAEWRPFLLILPGLGSCLRNLTAARFSDALGLCQKAGLNIQQSLVLAASATDDPLLLRRIDLAKKGIESGLPLAESLEKTECFSSFYLDILRCSEETGKLDDTLDWLARTSESELENALNTFADLMEPMVLLLVGTVVGVLVLATALPMVSVVQNL